MTTFLLIRHGETDANGKWLAGWTPGLHLNARGRRQAEYLAEVLATPVITAVYTSPLERALETAEPIARRHGLSPRPVQDLGELLFGDWEGMSFVELDGREDWRRFNTCRGNVRPPGGELMMESQVRMARQLECLAKRHPHEQIGLVSHGDPLRSLIAYCLGIPLDLMLRFEISPGSLSVVQSEPWGACVLSLNQTGEVPQ